jgi:CheY-like chemotaxis protein
MARILIVDDAKFMRTLVKDALIPKGHEIVGEAENGNEAVELYRSGRRDHSSRSEGKDNNGYSSRTGESSYQGNQDRSQGFCSKTIPPGKASKSG